jgi:hypothetical protein
VPVRNGCLSLAMKDYKYMNNRSSEDRGKKKELVSKTFIYLILMRNLHSFFSAQIIFGMIMDVQLCTTTNHHQLQQQQ